MNIVYCRLIIVLACIGYSLPFDGGSIKSYDHVLHDVSITVVKKLKFYRSFHHYLIHKCKAPTWLPVLELL